MDETLLNLALIAVLILLNAAFAGSELAMVSLRASQLRRLSTEHGNAGKRVAKMAEDPSRFLSTVQFGITLGGFLASAAAAVSLAAPLESRLGFLGGAAGFVSVIIVTLVLTFVTLVFGELVPKRIAMQRAESWSLRAARPLSVLATIASPAITLLSWTTNGVIRLLGARADAGAVETTEEEIRDLISHQTSVSPARRAILSGAFELDQRDARDILVPRRSVFSLDAGTSISEAMQNLIESGHSRAPIYADDTFTTVIHLRDLAASTDATLPVESVAREALIVPETLGVLDVLKRLQTSRQQLALVANEHGTIEGVITMEDVLEEIVGEIYDEFDRDTNESNTPPVKRNADGSFILPGSFPLHDLSDIDVTMPDTDQSTVAGLVIDQLQRIPRVGETTVIGDWHITVLNVEHNAIASLRFRPAS